MAFWQTLKAAPKAVLGGGIGRPIVGGIAGGIYGGATSENLDMTARFKDMLAGAAVGAGIGGMTTAPFWKMVGGAGKGIVGGIGRGAKRSIFGGMRNRKNVMAAAARGDMSGAMKAGMEENQLKRMALGGIGTASTLGRAAINNPKTALAIAGGTFGLGALAYTGMGNMGGSPPSAQNTIDFMNRNRVSSAGRRRFEQSTEGLTQAMYSGRHGGG